MGGTLLLLACPLTAAPAPSAPQDYAPRASVVPAALDLSDCPYAWPFCLQPLYHGAMPLVFNATVLNAMGVAGRFQGEPAYKATNDLGQHLQLQFEYSEVRGLRQRGGRARAAAAQQRYSIRPLPLWPHARCMLPVAPCAGAVALVRLPGAAHPCAGLGR